MNWALIVQIMTFVVLTGSAIAIWWQLDHQKQGRKTDQLIAWKNSALGLNRLAMQYPEVFKAVLYPRSKDGDEVRRLTSAYSSLHALEVMYYMRKNQEEGEDAAQASDRLDIFLREYVASYELRDAWKVDAAQMAFTDEFQKKLNAVINKNPLPPVTEEPPQKKERGDMPKFIRLTAMEGGKEGEILVNPDYILEIRREGDMTRVTTAIVEGSTQPAGAANPTRLHAVTVKESPGDIITLSKEMKDD